MIVTKRYHPLIAGYSSRGLSLLLTQHDALNLLLEHIDPKSLLIELPLDFLASCTDMGSAYHHEVIFLLILPTILKEVLTLHIIAIVMDEVDFRFATVYECHGDVALRLLVL